MNHSNASATTTVDTTSSGFECLVCRGTAHAVFAAGCRDLYLGFPGYFDYLQCRGCGHVQLHPIPGNLAAYYQGYPIHLKKSRGFSWLRQQVVGAAYGMAPTTPATVLDFGCGDGWYLQRLAAGGHTAIGFEADPGHASRLTRELGITVYSNATDLESRYAGMIDMITMHFVLEHVATPAALFQTAGRLLKPGGVWYFVIPSLESLEWRMFGRTWHGFDVPRHVSYLSDTTVQSLAQAASLTVEAIRPCGSATDFAGSLSNLITGCYRPAVFYAFLPLGMLWSRLFPGACRRYVLRKQGPGS